MPRRRARREENVKPGKDRFVAYHGTTEIGAYESRGVMLSKLLTFVLREKEDNSGTVRFEPVLGIGCTVFRVEKREGITRVYTLNNVE